MYVHYVFVLWQFNNLGYRDTRLVLYTPAPHERLAVGVWCNTPPYSQLLLHIVNRMALVIIMSTLAPSCSPFLPESIHLLTLVQRIISSFLLSLPALPIVIHNTRILAVTDNELLNLHVKQTRRGEQGGIADRQRTVE